MPLVNPEVLKRLRESKGMSQAKLAEVAKIDQQTISRLERGRTQKTRGHTVEQLARALKAEPSILTGDAPGPDAQVPGRPESHKTQFNVRIETATRNALFLLSERYNVRPWQIIELAPFLFCWAAETSLRRRRARIEEVEHACEQLRNAEGAISHLPVPNLNYSEEKIAAELASIERKDLFGIFLEDAEMQDKNFTHSEWTENPFASFLSDLSSDIHEVASFEAWSFIESPEYRVCLEEAKQIAGGDDYAAEAVLNGHVALHEIPKDIRDSGFKERTKWVRARAEKFRQELSEYINSRPIKGGAASS